MSRTIFAFIVSTRNNDNKSSMSLQISDDEHRWSQVHCQLTWPAINKYTIQVVRKLTEILLTSCAQLIHSSKYFPQLRHLPFEFFYLSAYFVMYTCISSLRPPYLSRFAFPRKTKKKQTKAHLGHRKWSPKVGKTQVMSICPSTVCPSALLFYVYFVERAKWSHLELELWIKTSSLSPQNLIETPTKGTPF